MSPASSGSLLSIERTVSPGFRQVCIPAAAGRELHLTLNPNPGESFPDMLRRLHAALRQQEARIVWMEIFGQLALAEGGGDALRQQFGVVDWPVAWVEGQTVGGAPIAGLHVLAVAGLAVEPLRWNDRVVGAIYNTGAARHCLIAGLYPDDPAATKSVQTRQVYDRLEALLGQAGFQLQQIARTWFYLEDILSWYHDFNKARNTFYAEKQLLGGLVPASTGISGRNPAGAALSFGAWAVQPLEGQASVQALFSPKQCPAPNYGSCFSRATEIVEPARRLMMISGTASIEPDGRSGRHGDIRGQIDLTMTVVQALLDTRHLTWADVSRATLYFKNLADVPVFESWRLDHHAPVFPGVIIEADVCRDELLFEIEVDAIAPVHR